MLMQNKSINLDFVLCVHRESPQILQPLHPDQGHSGTIVEWWNTPWMESSVHHRLPCPKTFTHLFTAWGNSHSSIHLLSEPHRKTAQTLDKVVFPILLI